MPAPIIMKNDGRMKSEAPYHKRILIRYFVPSILLNIVGVIMALVGAFDSNTPLFVIGMTLISIGAILVAIFIVLLFVHIPRLETTVPIAEKEPGTLYADEFVRLTDKEITFLKYSFCGKSARMLPYSSIEGIQSLEPTLSNGKWRIAGSRGNGIWFLWDSHRPSRDRIFVATIKNERTKLGFTVVNSDSVESILRQKGLIKAS
jgi:hypothetical protein